MAKRTGGLWSVVLAAVLAIGAGCGGGGGGNPDGGNPDGGGGGGGGGGYVKPASR